MDGAAAAKQVMALKDTIGKLKTVSGRQTNPAPGLGPEMAWPQAGIGALRSHQADFMTFPAWGRAHVSPQPLAPTLYFWDFWDLILKDDIWWPGPLNRPQHGSPGITVSEGMHLDLASISHYQSDSCKYSSSHQVLSSGASSRKPTLTSWPTLSSQPLSPLLLSAGSVVSALTTLALYSAQLFLPGLPGTSSS